MVDIDVIVVLTVVVVRLKFDAVVSWNLAKRITSHASRVRTKSYYTS